MNEIDKKNLPIDASTKEACALLKVVPETLRRWEVDGRIKVSRTPGGHRRYNIRSYYGIDVPTKSIKRRIVYARVSTREQQEDLERQVFTLKQQFPTYQVIKDIGSGLSFKRKGIKTLVEYLLNGEVQEVVVTHKDRLCRFGFELFELILSRTNPEGQIVVLDDARTSPEQELANDIISILTVFSARLYGLRSHKNKIKELICDNPIVENDKNQTVSRCKSDEKTEGDVLNVSVVL